MEIKINSKKHGEKIVLIDDKDYEKVKNYTWCVNKIGNSFYVISNGKKINNKRAIAYNNAAIKHHKKFALLNVIE